MKKLFLGLAFIAGSLTFAQQFGAKAGVNVSTISNDGWDDTKAKVGFHAGVFMNAPIAESFSIQPELLYNNLGAETSYNAGTFGTATSKLNLDYISVPVMFQYKIVPQFYLEAGPEFGFLISAKSKTSYTTPMSSGTTVSELNKDNFNGFNFGLGVGAGFNITNNIGVTARYVAGFTDATKPESGASTDAKNKNNVFQAGLNFKF